MPPVLLFNHERIKSLAMKISLTSSTNNNDYPTPRSDTKPQKSSSTFKLSKPAKALALMMAVHANARMAQAVQNNMIDPPNGQSNNNWSLYQIQFTSKVADDGDGYDIWFWTENDGPELVKDNLTEQECLFMRESFQKMGSIKAKINTAQIPKGGKYPEIKEISDQMPSNTFFCINAVTQQILERHAHN